MAKVPKSRHHFLDLPNPVLGTYNLHDVYWTGRLVQPLVGELEDAGQWQHYRQWVEPLQYAVVDMQRRGLKVDKGALDNYKKQVRRELRQADQIVLAKDSTGELAKPTGKSPNGIGSSKRLGKFLFQTLGLKPPKKTDTGLNSTDQEALYRILRDLRVKDQDHRLVLEALFHRSRLKTISQRYLNFPIDTDSRVRPVVKIAAAKTWRFAYENPPLQQWPKESRHVFTGRLLSVDFSQLEPRIQANLAGDEPDLLVFKDPKGDIYRAIALEMFPGVDLTPGHRGFTKSFRLGKGYGGRAETMKNKMFCPCGPELFNCIEKMPDTLNLSPAARKEAERRWEDQHPAYQQFSERLRAQINQHHYWDCPLGGRRYLSAPWSRELDRETKNLPMQMTAAQLMRRRQVELYQQLKAPIVLQMHDEFLLDDPSRTLREMEQLACDVRGIMESPLPSDCGVLAGVSFPTKAALGDTWGTLTELTA